MCRFQSCVVYILIAYNNLVFITLYLVIPTPSGVIYALLFSSKVLMMQLRAAMDCLVSDACLVITCSSEPNGVMSSLAAMQLPNALNAIKRLQSILHHQ